MITRGEYLSFLSLRRNSWDIQAIKYVAMFHKFESPSLWLVAQFRLEVQWHKHTMTEIIAEQTHAHHDLKGKEKGRAWVSISSFKHIFRSQHPLLLLPMVLSFWSVILCPSLQHMGLWGTFNTHAITGNDPARHIQTQCSWVLVCSRPPGICLNVVSTSAVLGPSGIFYFQPAYTRQHRHSS